MSENNNTKETLAVLFDFDGVLMDTESHYTEFWDTMGLKYTGQVGFGKTIKGQSLTHIFNTHFAGRDADQAEITKLLDTFERDMPYEYIAGAEAFVRSLRPAGIRTAVVTSSNQVKMANVYRTHPEFKDMFDAILTSEDFSRSKPDPECFLAAMQRLGVDARHSVVFEDSLFGLEAGRKSGAKVVALATTNPREVVAPLADMVIDDFTQMNVEAVEKLLR